MALSAGTRLSAYEILSALGAGGMGEVYRARDATLGRDVALKILPDAFARDLERLERFEREAKTLASLNHPHIAQIYGVEERPAGGGPRVRALVMELVEGEDLAQRLVRGPIPIDEALAIARQIAEALEAAHEQGIIHRDLKPANVKVKADGTVKVLDFGLAKALDPPASATADPMNSPTLTAQATKAGIILGTAAYMSPEQTRGKAVDKRSDIWAFGCLLFEMLTGRLAFAGDTLSDTAAAILTREPEWNGLPDTTPPTLRRLLQRCLEKDPRRRLRDVGDVRLEIEDIQSGPPADVPLAQRTSRRRERLAWASAVALVTLIAVVLAARAFAPASPPPEMRVELTTPPTTDPISLAISPDGQKVVFVAASDAGSQLWVRSVNTPSSQPLPGTVAAGLPFWSPDGRSIGFFADGKLERMGIDGGALSDLAIAPFGVGGAWNRDGVILFAPTPATSLFRIPATGGEPVAATTVEAPQQVGHSHPRFLPDSRHFLFYVDGVPEVRGVYVGDLGSAKTRRLLYADAAAAYSPSGALLFVRQGTLFAQDFDPDRLTLAGSSFPVADQMALQGSAAALSASDTGRIAYRTGSAGGPWHYVWFDRSGKEIGTAGDVEIGAQTGPELSRDGRRAALFRMANGNADIWLLDIARGVLERFTADSSDDIFPVWSPDGSRIVFSSTRKHSLDLYLKPVTGTADEELLLATPQIKVASDWSPDGHFVLYSSSDPKTGFDIWAVPMTGDRTPFPVVRTKFNEGLAQFSPDGKWIAYESNESGRYEIYVQRFIGAAGNAGGKVRISTRGGVQARWRRDGKALFYLALDQRLMEMPTQFASNGETVEPGAAVALFATRTPGGALQSFPRHQYDVSSDGRFLMIVDVKQSVAATPITVILHWAGQRK